MQKPAKNPSSCHLLVLLLQVLILLVAAPYFLLLLASDPQAGPNQSGRWTNYSDPKANWFAIQVHMALMRGDSTYHSKILAWQENHPPGPIFGVLKGWNPPPDSAAKCLVYQAAEFDSLQLREPPVNIFCSGFSHLQNGPLLVVGGHEGEETGSAGSSTFNPNVANPDLQWAPQGSMSARRWYPTSTSLPDGRVLATSGTEFLRILQFGGVTDPQSSNADSDNLLHRMALTTSGSWDSRVVPSPADPRPTPREGHTLALDSGLSNFILFGGRDTSGTLRNDVWLLFSSELGDTGEVYRWAGKTPATLPAPARRRLHTAVVRPDTLDMVLFGGIGQANNALVDMWKVWAIPGHPQNAWDWKEIIQGGSQTPGPRYGHGAFYERIHNRMFVFGGKTAGGAQPDSEVWSFSFATSQWSKPTLVSPSTRPRWREGHALVGNTEYDRGGPFGIKSQRAVLFGGETSSGLTNDAWLLWVSATADSVRWESLNTPSPPSGRKRCAAAYDLGFDRLVVSGGQTGTTTSTSEVWGLSLEYWNPTTQSTPATWSALASNPNASRSGSAAAYGEVAHFARYPEIYNAGSWTKLPTPKRLPWYPYFFVLPSGNVFYAGSDDTTHILNMSTYSWSTIGQANVRLPGGSAVMYRPGKVMKCGTAQSGQSVTSTPSQMRRATSKIEFDAADNTSGWVYSDSLDSARVYHNLTLLPNGKVLCTGGMSADSMQVASGPVNGPRIWDPNQGTNGTWSGAGVLALDPARRNYHSTALLLPDGRVLSAGGNLIPEESLITVFCPPYLFNSSGGLATRPTIQGLPDTLGYGKIRTICTPQASTIGSACLIKPSAVTHAFNEDQRYVPLPITSRCGTDHLLVSTPNNANEAPPGDYLLFIVDSTGVPAIAKWVLVTSQGGQDDCDNTAPNSISDLTIMDYGQTYVDLSWTAPGDDGLCGTAQEFDVRYSTSPITESTWANAVKATGEPTPGPPGTLYTCFTIAGLTSCTNYYFAMKTMDDRPQLSALSNQPGVKTRCSGGGPTCDGGGLAAQSWGDGSWAPENSLFWESGASQAFDFYGLKGSAGPVNGEYVARFLKVGTGRADLDQVGLGVVDHDAGVSAFASGDRAFLGTTSAVQSVTDGSGANVTSQVSGSSAQPYAAAAGQTLLVTLGGSSSNTGLVVESSGYASGVAADSSGILAQAQRSDGTWGTLAQIHPRRTPDSYAVDAEGNNVLRLLFLRDHAIRSLRRMSVTDKQNPQWLPLSRAVHSRLGDVRTAVGSSGGTSTTLVPGDALELGFATTPVPAGKVRSLFLQAKGAYTTKPASRVGEVVLAGPTYDFALGPARPNPSAGSVNFSFTMARAGPVSILVYDVAGRLVRTLVNGSAEAGPHDIEWNATDDGGRRVGASVYFYRMVAGSWVSQRKVVFIER